MPNQALYYPWIDVRDDEWLKSSLLYWDEIRTIVPESLDDPYRTDSTRALYDSGVLSPIRVNSNLEEIEGLAESVLTHLKSNEGARLIASNGQRSSRIHTEKLPRQLEKFAHIHPEKLPYIVRDELERLFHNTNRDGDWLRVDEGFADFYMTLLASKLSDRTGASLVTNNTLANDLAVSAHLDATLTNLIDDNEFDRGRRFREFAMFRRRRDMPHTLAEGLLANLAISKVSISSENSIEDILSFKETYRDELGRFHSAISSLCHSIDKDIPMEALQEAVESIYANEIKPAVNDLKSALTGKKITWKVEGLLKLSFLSASSYSALAVAGLSTPIALLAGAGISLTGMGVLHSIEKQNEVRNSPFAYLFHAEKDFV